MVRPYVKTKPPIVKVSKETPWNCHLQLCIKAAESPRARALICQSCRYNRAKRFN